MTNYKEDFHKLRAKYTSSQRYTYELYEVTDVGDYKFLESNISRDEFEKQKPKDLQYSSEVSLRHFKKDDKKFAYLEQVQDGFDSNGYFRQKEALFKEFKDDFIKKHNITEVEVFNEIVSNICGLDRESDIVYIEDYFHEHPLLLKSISKKDLKDD